MLGSLRGVWAEGAVGRAAGAVPQMRTGAGTGVQGGAEAGLPNPRRVLRDAQGLQAGSEKK